MSGGFGGAVKLTGESEYKRALKEITLSLKEVSSEMKVVSAQFGKNDNSVKALTSRQGLLNDKLKDQKAKLEILKAQYESMSSQFDTQTKKHNDLVKSYEDEKAKLEEIGDELGTNSKEYEEQKAKVDALEKEVMKSAKAQDANKTALTNMRVAMNRAEADIITTTKELDGLESALEDAKKAEEADRTATEQLTQTINGQEKELAELKTAYKDIVLEFGAGSKEAKEMGSEISRLSSDLATNKTRMREADAEADKLDKSLDDAGKSVKGAEKNFSTFSMVMGGIVLKAVMAVGNAIRGSLGGAVQRVDTITAYTKTMKNLGYSQKEVKKSSDEMLKGLEGLPTTLPQISSMQQQYVALTGDLDKATKLSLALNDATLASGKGQEEASRASEHWYSILANGRPEMDNWKELTALMPAQLKQISEKLLGTGKSSQDLYKAWKDGKVTTEDVMDALIDLDQKGGGGLESFSKQAKDASGGIGTSLENIKTAIIKDMASIIEAIGGENIAGVFQKIEAGIYKFGAGVTKVVEFVKQNSTVIIAILGGVTASLITLFAIGGGFTALARATLLWASTLKIVTVAQTLLNIAMEASPIGLIIVAIAGLVTAFVILWNKSEAFRNFWIGLWEKIKAVALPVIQGLVTWFRNAWDKIKAVWNVVDTFFKDKFAKAVKAIKHPFQVLPSFFSGIWSRIKNTFSSLGTKIGSAIGGAVKSGINSAISLVESTINRGIGLINGAIDIINKVPKVNIGHIPSLNLPRLASGGVLERGQVGILEGSGAEAVVPLENNTKWIRKVAEDMRNALITTNTMSQEREMSIDYTSAVDAFKEALSDMEIILDDERAGKFVERTVTNLIYT